MKATTKHTQSTNKTEKTSHEMFLNSDLIKLTKQPLVT